MSDALDVDEFLAHFGVKGMHWGVVHEPDPGTGHVKKGELSTSSRQAKREGVAQKYDKKASDSQSQIDKIKSQQSGVSQTKRQVRSDNKKVKDLTKVRDIAVSDADKKRQGKLTSKQKKVIVGVTVVGALVAAAVLTHNIQSGEVRRLATKGAAFVQGRKATDFARKDLLAKKMSPDLVHKLVVKDINPDFSRGDFGARMNCRRATFAYEMRRRGFDVAATKTTSANGQNAAGFVNAVTANEKKIGTTRVGYMAQIIREAAAKEKDAGAPTRLMDAADTFSSGAHNKIHNVTPAGIFETLAKQPNGSRGEISVGWKIGGGHSMAYEIFDGKPVIFDAQSNSKISGVEDLIKHGPEIAEAGFSRLDNIELNSDFLLRWVKNSK